MKLAHGGLERRLLVHVPPAIEAGSDLPLVLALHPLGYTAQMMAAFCNLGETADRNTLVGGTFILMAVLWNGLSRARRATPTVAPDALG